MHPVKLAQRRLPLQCIVTLTIPARRAVPDGCSRKEGSLLTRDPSTRPKTVTATAPQMWERALASPSGARFLRLSKTL